MHIGSLSTLVGFLPCTLGIGAGASKGRIHYAEILDVNGQKKLASVAFEILTHLPVEFDGIVGLDFLHRTGSVIDFTKSPPVRKLCYHLSYATTGAETVGERI